MAARIWLVTGLLFLAGCAGPPVALRVTRTGGDSYPQVKADATGQPDLRAIGVGDTLLVSPGNRRTVVPSTQLTYTLVEPRNVAEEELKKSLSINRREAPKIQFVKTELLRGDSFRNSITLDMSRVDQRELDRKIHLLAFNRGEKAFRGDLSIYDLMPPELQLVSVEPAEKYVDRTRVKAGLSWLPIIGLLTMAMDNYGRTGEKLDMAHEKLGEMNRYSFRRLALDPGEAIGIVLNVRYVMPSADELIEMREVAGPVSSQGQ